MRARAAPRARAQRSASSGTHPGGAGRGPEPHRPRELRGRTRHNKTVNFAGLAQPGDLVAGRDHRRDVDHARRRGVPRRARRLTIVALFGPDRGRQDRGRGRARGRCCARAARSRSRCRPTRSQVYEGLDVLAAKPTPTSRAARAPAGLVRADRRGVQRRRATPSSRTPRSTRCSTPGSTPIVVGGTGPLPARRAHRARPEPAARAPACASSSSASWPRSGPARCTGGCRPRRPPRRASERPQADRAGARARADGDRAARALGRALVASSCAARRRCSASRWSARRCSRGSASRVGRDARRRRGRGGRARARARRLAHRAQGARLRGDRRAPARASSSLDEAARASSARHLAYVKRQLTWMRKLAGVEADRPHRVRPADGAAVASGSLRLPPPCGSRSGRRSATTTSSSSATSSRSSSRPSGCGASARRTSAATPTASCSSRRPATAVRGRAADLQPRRLRGRAVGQRRARGGPLPAPQRLDRRDDVLDRDRRGRDPADDHRRRTCTVDMGRARLRSPDFPSGPDDGRGTVVAGGREFAFQHVTSATRSARSRPATRLEELDLRAHRPPIERTSCSRTARTCRSPRRAPATACARGSSSAAWGRRCPRAPAPPAPRSPRVLRGATAR